MGTSKNPLFSAPSLRRSLKVCGPAYLLSKFAPVEAFLAPIRYALTPCRLTSLFDGQAL